MLSRWSLIMLPLDGKMFRSDIRIERVGLILMASEN
jgi:hypothetical protein